jgi:hypothetical protein
MEMVVYRLRCGVNSGAKGKEDVDATDWGRFRLGFATALPVIGHRA